MFQFQIGAIRGRLQKPGIASQKEFQFQIGAIRGPQRFVLGSSVLRFNSKLVRLEGAQDAREQVMIT